MLPANKDDKPYSHSYGLKIRLLFLVGAAFLVWAGIMFPLLSFTLEGLLSRGVKAIQDAQGVAANTIARLMVLEFSQWRDLLQMTMEEEKRGERRIKNLLWEKVVFNEVIEGIELIQAAADDEDRHLTYLYYRNVAPDPDISPEDRKKLKPMEGPQKINRKFSGLEKELIDNINKWKKVDKLRLESINRGPLGSEMTVRYMPVHVLVKDQGAVYWGVAKIGVNTSAIRKMRLLQSQEHDQIRRIIWLEIFLSVGIVTLVASAIGYQWVRNYTEPLKQLELAARGLNDAKPGEFDFWVDNLRFVDSNKQREIESIREILLRMSAAIRKISQRLITTERQASWGRTASGVISVIQNRLNRIQSLMGQPDPAGQPTGDAVKELSELVEQLQTDLQDLEEFVPTDEKGWRAVDLTPALNSAWRLIAGNLPATVKQTLELTALPPVWGSPSELKFAVFYLLEYAGSLLAPYGELTLRTLPDSTVGSVGIHLRFSGPRLSAGECQNLLNPSQDPEAMQGALGPALAAAIAARHRGSLSVQPWDEGLIFQLILPKAPVPDESKET